MVPIPALSTAVKMTKSCSSGWGVVCGVVSTTPVVASVVGSVVGVVEITLGVFPLLGLYVVVVLVVFVVVEGGSGVVLTPGRSSLQGALAPEGQ